MRIAFDKIGSSTKPFEINIDKISLSGGLTKKGFHKVALEATKVGKLDLDCDRCGKEYSISLNDDLKLTLSDRVLKDKEDLDIIEFLDGVVDIHYILESEINILKSNYHYCPDCTGESEEIEIEF